MNFGSTSDAAPKAASSSTSKYSRTARGASAGGSGSGIERSLGCNALIYNDAVFLNPFSSDLGGKHRAEAMPPEPDGFVAYVYTALVQQILDVSQREWETNVQHHRQADDLFARIEVFERVTFPHPGTLPSPPTPQQAKLL